MDKFSNIKKKFVNILKKTRKKVFKYFSTNRLFITYLVFCLIETVLIRNYTLKDAFNYEPFICDLALLIIFGSFGYFIKPRKQFNYYFILMFIVTLMCVVNSIYYTFYTSFASFSLLAELSLVGDVGDSLVEKFKFIDFIYVIFPILFILLHTKLKNGSYYHFVSKVEDSKKMFGTTMLVGIIVLVFTLVNITGTDVSRLVKQWNREYIVQRFGIILYQGNDLVQSLTPKINSLFGYDEAAKEFREFYQEKNQTDVHEDNEYTNVLEGMNIVFVHMESMQSFLIDMEVNDVEITPTLNWLTQEGMYFSNFYPQISVGTSSDTEFTLNTSLMPVSSGTVFMQYFDRNYVSIPKILSDKGYYTFSAHANAASMWGRSVMHPNLGYQELIFKDQFEGTSESDSRWVGLGLSDYDFFQQLQSKLEKIEDEHDNYMGTLIQLSNHSPFAGTLNNPELYNYFGTLDLTNTYTKVDEKTGETEVVTDDYLKDTKLGNYMISAHYADMSLGTFLDYVKNSDYYENTVFVFYGDHDAKLDKKEYQYYYNYNTETGQVYEEGDLEYRDYDNFQHEINKRTPLVIWTKNETVMKKIKGEYSNVMGMYDVLPTIGNMMGFESDYALGHDVFDIGEDNVVIFPNGSFVTNKVYYSSSSNSYFIIGCDNILSNVKNGKIGKNKKKQCNSANTVVISEDYISDLIQYTEKRLTISNDIIVYNLIEKEGDNIMNNTENESGNGDG